MLGKTEREPLTVQPISPRVLSRPPKSDPVPEMLPRNTQYWSKTSKTQEQEEKHNTGSSLHKEKEFQLITGGQPLFDFSTFRKVLADYQNKLTTSFFPPLGVSMHGAHLFAHALG